MKNAPFSDQSTIQLIREDDGTFTLVVYKDGVSDSPITYNWATVAGALDYAKRVVTGEELT